MSKINVYKAHETRMWIKDIILPAIGIVGGVILGNDSARENVKETALRAKNWVMEKVKK